MFRFTRKKILPLFFAKKMTVAELARQAHIAHQSAWRALNGESVSAKIIKKVAEALKIDAVEFLDTPPQKGDCNIEF